MVYFSGQPTKASLSIKFQQTNHYTEKCTIGKCVQYPTVRVILLPLPRRQVPFRIWKLGGRVRNQTRVNLSRMILEEIMVSSHNLLSSLIDQASTCVFYTSGPVLGNAGGRGGVHNKDQNWHGLSTLGAYILTGKTDIEGLEMRIGVQGSGESLMSRKGKEY